MTAAGGSLYAEPRTVAGVEECLFYHTMDLPGVGLVEGPWDLRPSAGDYLGNLDLRGKRALDVGTASGFLTFEMERRGAEVVSYDLGESMGGWDLVPFGGRISKTMLAERSSGIGRINNAWWLAHQALGSRARVVYGPVYEMPSDIGPVDVAVFGAILLHLRDPFLALQRALELT
ncbi:MAG: class I SAM-dependent methyltransferase, partial [Acidimicrobiales bacterium]